MNLRADRRGLLLGMAAAVCGGKAWAAGKETGAKVGGGVRNGVSDQVCTEATNVATQIAALEQKEGGRLGLAALDTGSGRRLRHRADERFALCSTFKFVAAATILQRVDRGVEHLERRVEYRESDLLEYAPVSKEHVKEGGMALADVCSAAVEWSDNTAANLMLKILGGPAGLTGFIRTLGDNVTRVDNDEPALNVVAPGEVHDTSTPAAMVGLLSTVLFGRVLSPQSRARLEGWMLDAKVGQHRIPAGLPPGWRIAHKTGTGSNQTNDVGVVWPPDRAPIIVAAFYVRDETRQEQREGVLRDVGRIVAAGI